MLCSRDYLEGTVAKQRFEVSVEKHVVRTFCSQLLDGLVWGLTRRNEHERCHQAASVLTPLAANQDIRAVFPIGESLVGQFTNFGKLVFGEPVVPVVLEKIPNFNGAENRGRVLVKGEDIVEALVLAEVW